jgi:UDP-2,3-diacylglucosamine pyrophosphatase LpxH
MLVITSDWHLADKTAGLDMPAGAFALFQERLCDMAYDASQRGDGTYKPIDSLDLLLLGDIFDPLRSALWTEEEKGAPGYARPWSKANDPAFVKKLDQITDAIIRDNTDAFKILRSIAGGDGVSLPPATKDQHVDMRVSRDPRSVSRLPVKVRIHYMIGNHDWYYHLPGAGLDQVRQKIVDAMGLSNPPSAFPYVPSESGTIDQVLRQHGVFARHGDFHDPYNIYKQDRDHASISDAVCVELFNRIAVQITNELHDRLVPEFFRDLKELGSIRPELMTPVWIASLFERYNVPQQDRLKVNDIWHDLVRQFLKLDFLQELDEPFKFDLVDALKAAFSLARLISMDTLTDWALAIEKLESLVGLVRSGSMGSEEWVKREPAFQSGEARFIVYGHTHQPVVCPIRSLQRGALPLDQIYLNSGTWHPMHQICDTESGKKSFVYYKTMTYLGLYCGDERRCKAYESWSGTLDI